MFSVLNTRGVTIWHQVDCSTGVNQHPVNGFTVDEALEIQPLQMFVAFFLWLLEDNRLGGQDPTVQQANPPARVPGTLTGARTPCSHQPMASHRLLSA